MVGFLYAPATEEEEEFNQTPELKKSNDPLDLSLRELDDFSLSFADSFLDFDSVKDWIEESADPYNMTDLKPDPDRVDSEKVEFEAVEERIEMAEDESCKETIAEDPVGDGSGKLGSLGCLIEEEMGKVSLEGVLAGSVVVGANGTNSGEGVGVNGNGGNSGEIVSNCDGAKSGEIVGIGGNGVKSAVTVSVDGDGAKRDDTVSINGNGVKSGEIASDGDESESDSESESASSTSTSSSSSSNGKDDAEEEESGEEEEEEEDKRQVEGKMDVEEGEIRDSDEEEMVAWSNGEDEEEEDGGSIMAGPIRSKNEVKMLPPVPAVNVTLQPYHQTLPAGVVLSIMGAQVIVEGVEKHNPLNEGSILWITESRSPLGLIDEIFGPVKNPYYVVRYNSDSEVPAGIQQGTSISFIPEFASHVLNDNNLYKKGYDASGENDEELSDELEFSDDEKEAEYKRMLKMTKRGTNDQNVGNRKKEKKKFRNWKNDQPSATQALAGLSQLPVDQNQLSVPTVTASLDYGNCSRSSGPGQGLIGGPGLVPPFPQLAQVPGFIAPPNGVWTGQPQNMGFSNGFPTNGMQWLQQNHPQQPYQMILPNGMPFQQPFDTSQRFPPNFVLPSGQSNFGPGQAFAPWPACFAQSDFNQSPFGMQVQCAPPSMNMGEQGVRSNGLQTVHHSDMRPPFNSGNTESSQNFNRGVNFSRGRKPYHRGGGRFGSGRVRKQSN